MSFQPIKLRRGSVLQLGKNQPHPVFVSSLAEIFKMSGHGECYIDRLLKIEKQSQVHLIQPSPNRLNPIVLL